jgi:oligosaccharyl transferase (archaeosortase A-associated)
MARVRRDVVLVLLLAVAAFGIRTYPAWDAVFTPAGVSFLETDAWYHVRLVENQVRNFPWRLTDDPYAAPTGQFVPIAPLFDTITATMVMVAHGRDATAAEVERIAAFMPPVFGTLAVVVAWAVGRRLFDRRAGLIAAGLLTVLPGHFMERTMLGFVDHHALEALLAMVVVLCFTRGLMKRTPMAGALAGVSLGLYLLAWGSGALLVAIIGGWLIAYAAIARTYDELADAALLTGFASVVSFLLVVAFQDPAMHRYGSQIFGLLGLAAAAFATAIAARHPTALPGRTVVFGSVAVVGVIATIVLVSFAPGLFRELLIDVGRLAPDPMRMGVLEARPLFRYSGNWSWLQPWLFFRTGFFIGIIALAAFAFRIWKHRAPADLLLWVFAMTMLIATIGQNRFGYYLVTAFAVLGGWLAMELLDWAGVPHAADPQPAPRTRMPFAREAAVIAIAGGMFAPNLAPAVLLAERRSNFPIYWRAAMEWLRDNTPSPFGANGGDAFYYARYPSPVPVADHTVLNWWDQGYWIIQQARRVPVANPTQARATRVAEFYTATDEATALAIARTERSRYVLADFELPFRRASDGSILGRFQTIANWTGQSHDRFYEVAYRRDGSTWVPVWIFHEPYYRAMAFRLSALGGHGTTPVNTTSVLMLVDRVDENGVRFREVVGQQTYLTHDAAVRAAIASPDAIVVGLDPWQSAFPLEPLKSFVQVHAARTPEQDPTHAPWVRVFELR